MGGGGGVDRGSSGGDGSDGGDNGVVMVVVVVPKSVLACMISLTSPPNAFVTMALQSRNHSTTSAPSGAALSSRRVVNTAPIVSWAEGIGARTTCT